MRVRWWSARDVGRRIAYPALRGRLVQNPGGHARSAQASATLNCALDYACRGHHAGHLAFGTPPRGPSRVDRRRRDGHTIDRDRAGHPGSREASCARRCM